MQQPSRRGLPQGVKARLSLAVFYVRLEHERHVEIDLLDFSLADLVCVCTFTIITGIPIEPFRFSRSRSWVYIFIVYSKLQPMRASWKLPSTG